MATTLYRQGTLESPFISLSFTFLLHLMRINRISLFYSLKTHLHYVTSNALQLDNFLKRNVIDIIYKVIKHAFPCSVNMPLFFSLFYFPQNDAVVGGLVSSFFSLSLFLPHPQAFFQVTEIRDRNRLPK